MIRRFIGMTFLFALTALAADLEGTYTGTYSSDNGSDGKIQTTLKKNADAWDCQFSFTTDSGDVAAKVVSCTIEGNLIKSEYNADVDGTAIHVVMEGTAAADKSMTGTYKTTGANGDVVDQGKWKASPRP